MPVRPERRAAYPPGWKALSAWIRFTRAGGRCECDGRCGRPGDHLGHDGRCRARHGDPMVGSSGKAWTVVLTVAHLTHDETVDDPDLLGAYCASCHLSLDAEHHAETRRARQADPTKGAMMLW